MKTQTTKPPPAPRVHPEMKRVLLRPIADECVEQRHREFQSEESTILTQIDSKCHCDLGIIVSDNCKVNPSVTCGSSFLSDVSGGTLFTGSRTFLVKEIEIFEIQK
jgi:hypothetical protein